MEELQKLDIKQLNILVDFINGKNIFMSGPGGTGKSFLIEIIKKYVLKQIKYINFNSINRMLIVLLINAKTIHFFLSIGIIKMMKLVTYYINKIRNTKKL